MSTAGNPNTFVAPAGLPDAAALARMANEFFKMVPGEGSPSIPVTPPAVPPEVSLPADPHFPGAPDSAGATLAPVLVPGQASPPTVPGVFSSVGDGIHLPFVIPGEAPSSAVHPSQAQTPRETNRIPADPAAFAFLEEARPLFSSHGAGAPDLAGFSRDLGLSEVVELPGAPPPSATSFQPPHPAPPASVAFFDSSAFPAFSFIEEARPLFSPAPVKEPIRGDLRPEKPLDLNLSSHSFDAEALKRDFPILRERVNGRPLVWLDNAATTQKPQSVIDRLKYFYEHENSNVHRAAHELAARATDAYESAREKVRRFVGASSSREIIFVRGCTEGINLVAQSWGRHNIQKDDEIVITWLEHHANIVPWQMLCAEKGARLRVAPVDDSGQILLDEYEKLLGPRTRLVSLSQVSNALGVVTPAAEMIAAAHRHGAKVLLDGAQSVSHMRVDVQALDCDFFVFSGHKVFGPTGIGAVYGKPEILEHMPPWQGGGNMIVDVTFEKTVYQPAPQRFEAGTGNIADAVGLGAAIDYVDRVGMENISRHEHGLLVYATERLLQIPGLRIIGTAKEKAGVLSFVLDGFRNEEVGDYLNRHGIAVRSGHHCAQPILRRFGLESSVRASLALYNTVEDINALVTALTNLRFGRTAIA